MKNSVIAFIGAGNMGSALAGGLIAHGHSAKNIWLTDPSIEKIEHLHKELGIHATTQNDEAIAHADIVIFAVKPQIMADVVKKLAAPIQTRKPLVMSIATGISAETLQQWLGENIAIVRVMPNTPALIGAGASGLFANRYVTAEQHQLAEDIMSTVGITVWLDNEKTIEAVTALSGSGPAYFFLIIEAMQQAGEELGLSKEMSRLLTLQTAYGAARMALESDRTVQELRQQVTSPGGTTEQAIRVFEEGKIRDLIKKALAAAKIRAEELGNSPT